MKKIKYILGTLALILSLQSCNDLLDQDNPNTVTTSQALSSLAGVNNVNLGFYVSVPFASTIYTQTIITDEVVYPNADNQNQGGGRGLYTWEYTPGTVTERDNMVPIWQSSYLTIHKTNLVINSVSDLHTINASEENLKKLYKAEAYGMRAFSHFELLRAFSPKYSPTALGVPYKTSTDIYETPARLTMAETYAKILEDIEQSLTLFTGTTVPSGYGGTYTNNRLTKQAVLALKAKVSLELGNYNDAIAAATEAVGNRTLVNSSDKLVSLWSDSNDFEEVIFKISQVAGSSSSNLGASWLYANGQVQWNSSASLMTKYEASDYRNDLFIDMADLGLSNLGKVPGKYLLPYFNSVKPNFGMGDLKVYRTADLLLVISEAYARQNDLSNALTSYKKVRDARNAGASTAFTSQADALSKILDERARELAYEGSRLTDLKRFDKTVSRIAQDFRPIFPMLQMTDVNKLTYAIPQAEIFNNSNMQQNPGY